MSPDSGNNNVESSSTAVVFAWGSGEDWQLGVELDDSHHLHFNGDTDDWSIATPTVRLNLRRNRILLTEIA